MIIVFSKGEKAIRTFSAIPIHSDPFAPIRIHSNARESDFSPLIEAIEHLGRIVLTENVFIYENKYYRQVIGGAMGSPFTLTLANIFMWDWEQELVENQRNSNELYGR
jgi:hypothetical protein